MDAKQKKGVVVITLTATVYIGAVRQTLRSRVGFAAEFRQDELPALKEKLKELYMEQMDGYKFRGRKPDKIECRAGMKVTECEMLLNGADYGTGSE